MPSRHTHARRAADGRRGPKVRTAHLALGAALAVAAGVAQAAAFSYITPPNPAKWAEGTDKTVHATGLGSVTMRWSSPGDSFYKPDDEFFEGPPANNPAWVAGTRLLFDVEREDGSSSRLDYTLTFAGGLPKSAYLVFADFENRETVAIKAYDADNNLIPYTAFLLQQWDGGESGGSLLDYLTYSSATNEPAPGYSFQVEGKSGFGSYSDDLAWTLSFNTPIHRLEYEMVHTGGGAKFNVAAAPEPGTLALMALGLAGIGWGRRRITPKA